MTSQTQSVTPVRVPKAATAYAPTTQDPDLRSQINTLLLREGHVEKIEQALHHALHAHPSNWPARVSLHALSLLRSGECTTFPKLMERVLADIRCDTEAARRAAAADAPKPHRAPDALPVASRPAAGKANGTPLAKGKTTPADAGAGAAGVVNGVTVANGVVGPGNTTTTTTTTTGLAVPQTVIDEGMKITRECLEQVCEVDE